VGIVNRRNAVLGWSVWTIGKRVVRRKTKSTTPYKPLSAAAIAGLVGAVTFWRKRRASGD
jgi:hypothetical protein